VKDSRFITGARYVNRKPVPSDYKIRPESTSLLISWLFVALCVICGIILSLYDLRLEGGAVAVLGFGALYFNLDRRLMPELPFGPCTFAYLPHMLGFALGPLGQRYLTGTEYFSEDGFFQGQWGAVAGLATFAIIYFIVFRRVRKSVAGKDNKVLMLISKSQWGKYSVTLLFIATFIIIMGFITGNLRRLGPEVEVAPGVATLSAAFYQVSLVVFFFLAFVSARFGGRWTLVWLTSFTVFAILFILDGTRGPVVMAALISTIGAIAGGGSKRKILLASAVFIILFFPISGIVNEYRSIFRQVVGLGERIEGFSTSIDIYASKYREGSSGWFTTVLEQSTAHTVDRVFLLTPQIIPFVNFDELDRVIYLYIPRAFAPDRRSLQDGNDIAVRYDPFAQEKNNYTPAVADGYRRWGWIGIPIIYALQGFIFAFVLGVLHKRRDRPQLAAMIVLMILSAHEIWSNTLLSTIYLAGWTIPKYYLFFKFLSWLKDRFSPFQEVRVPAWSRRPTIKRNFNE
jgi:hypothetical protein